MKVNIICKTYELNDYAEMDCVPNVGDRISLHKSDDAGEILVEERVFYAPTSNDTNRWDVVLLCCLVDYRGKKK